MAAGAALLAVAAAILWQLPIPEASAHAALVRSNPANGEKMSRPPVRVILNFSEPIERRLTKVQVFDKDRNQVDAGDIEFDAKDPTFASVGLKEIGPGLYLVEFANVSTVDGHPWNGVFQFIVLNPDGSAPAGVEFNTGAASGAGATGLLPPKADAALKWFALLSLCIVAGSAFFILAVARPAASFMEDEAYQRVIARAEGWLINAGHILLPLGFISMMFLVLLTVNRFETSTSLGTYLVSIQAGRYRSLFLVSAIVALIGIDVLNLASKRRVRDVGLAMCLAASLVALFSFSATSHGGVGIGSFWAVTSDYIHLVASAAWLGALAMLLPFFWWSRKVLSQEQTRFLYTANLFDRFSIIAGLSVIAILATGTFNGLAQIPNWDAMIHTSYGRVLVVKLAMIVPLLAVAGLNAFVIKPRLVDAIDGMYQNGGGLSEEKRDVAERQLSRMQRLLPYTVAAEVALVVAVFASVAVLSQTSTAKGEIASRQSEIQSASGFKDEKPAGDLQLEFIIKPNRVGLNQYTLNIKNADGSPVTDATQVRLRYFYTDPSDPNLKTGQTELILNRFGDGVYQGSGAYFSQPGSWRVEAGIRREGKDDVSRNFVVSVPPAESKQGATGGKFSLPFTSLTWNEVVGALLAIAGGIAWLYTRQFNHSFGWDKRWLAAAGAVLIIGGGTLAFSFSPGSSGDLALGNPVKPTEASIAKGRMLFAQNCMVCHGVDGRGDGPNAASLDPAPSDFRLHVPLHTDPQFYAFIANGFAGSAMPAWKGKLTDDDIWNLVNFLRSEFKDAPTARAP